MSVNSLDFKIKGGKKLYGKVITNTSKNGAMGLLAASLLNKGTTILHGIPRIEEVNRICEVLESINVKLEWIAEKSLKINADQIDLTNINYESATKTRTILMFIGSLVHTFDDFKIPNSQGCKLGKAKHCSSSIGTRKTWIQSQN
jgi:UDP-N-acetylglucosamine 1-carboxyvinyltransferase